MASPEGGRVFSSLREEDTKGKKKKISALPSVRLPFTYPSPSIRGDSVLLLHLNFEEHARKAADESPVTREE